MGKYTNNKALALDIIRGKWLLDDASSAKMLDAARVFLSKGNTGAENHEPLAISFQALDGAGVGIENTDNAHPGAPSVLIVPLGGTLTKYDNCFGTATLEVVDILEQYREDDNIIGFILDIDSPGGAVNAVMPLVEEIRRIQASGKPIISHCDFCASAAYWIASQTDLIIMDNLLSEVGSVGVCASLVDDRENKATGERHFTIYAPESKDKNKSYRDALDGKAETLEAELSRTARVFQDAVKAGRPKLKAEAGVLSGAMFDTAKAIDLNMADAMGDLSSCVGIVYARSGKL